uniref:Beta-glucosidase n=1 Tax=Ruminococcus flavefaciens TaxID=1265 RepID=Q52748_RUMFL|nr:beta-glucosidase [Ruminococcus flavefaciens]
SAGYASLRYVSSPSGAGLDAIVRTVTLGRGSPTGLLRAGTRTGVGLCGAPGKMTVRETYGAVTWTRRRARVGGTGPSYGYWYTNCGGKLRASVRTLWELARTRSTGAVSGYPAGRGLAKDTGGTALLSGYPASAATVVPNETLAPTSSAHVGYVRAGALPVLSELSYVASTSGAAVALRWAALRSEAASGSASEATPTAATVRAPNMSTELLATLPGCERASANNASTGAPRRPEAPADKKRADRARAIRPARDAGEPSLAAKRQPDLYRTNSGYKALARVRSLRVQRYASVASERIVAGASRAGSIERDRAIRAIVSTFDPSSTIVCSIVRVVRIVRAYLPLSTRQAASYSRAIASSDRVELYYISRYIYGGRRAPTTALPYSANLRSVYYASYALSVEAIQRGLRYVYARTRVLWRVLDDRIYSYARTGGSA